MKRSLTLTQKGFILVGVPLVCELAFITISMNLLRETEREVARQSHSREVLACCNALVEEIYTASTAFKKDNLPDPHAMRDFAHKFIPSIEGRMQTLADLVKANPEQSRQANLLQSISHENVETVNELRHSIAEDPITAGARIKTASKKLATTTQTLQKALSSIMAKEREIEEQSPIIQARFRARAQQALLIAAALNAALAISLAIYFNKSTSRRLDSVLQNTYKLALSQPLNPPLEGKDEIAHLDRVFNRMAELLNEAARKERAIVDNAVDVICTIDGNLRLTAVNPAADRVWGYSPDELIGKNISSIIQSDDLERTSEEFKAVIGSDKTVSGLENRVKHKDKHVVDMSWSAQWSNPEKSLFCSAHDISERKRIDRLKQDFVAMVSHDLRSPLTSILAICNMFQSGVYGEMSEAGQGRLTQMDNTVKRLISLIKDLLDMEKFESGSVKLELSDVPLNRLFERCVESTEAFANQQGVEIVVESNDDKVMVDEDKIVQVLVNLTNNGIKFSPKKTVVRLSSRKTDDHIEFCISDSGRGVPEDLREHIFDRFTQVEKSDATDHGGSGLGLAICKAIVQQHSGSIGVRSEAGKGSTFWFQIPSAAIDDA